MYRFYFARMHFKWMPQRFGQLNSLFRSKHGVVYTYELVKRYRIAWRTRAVEEGKRDKGRSDMKSPIQWTWGSGLRPLIDLRGLSRVVTADYVQSHYSLLLLFRDRLRLSFSFLFFALDCWVTPTENVTFGTYFRASLLATRSLNKILAHVYEKDGYPRHFPFL